MSEEPVFYCVGAGVSFTGKGVWWPVIESHGKCFCGEAELGGVIAYFGSQLLAQQYAESRNRTK